MGLGLHNIGRSALTAKTLAARHGCMKSCVIGTALLIFLFGVKHISHHNQESSNPTIRSKQDVIGNKESSNPTIRSKQDVIGNRESSNPTIHSKQDLIGDQKTLIILTQTRSGSSFAGEIFAATNDSFYLYEPMYPFGLECDWYTTEKAELLKKLLSCDFENLDSLYAQGYEKSHWDDSVPHCRKHGLCFVDASTGLITKYKKTCNNANRKNCGYPLKADILKKACESSSFVLTKTTRMCTLENLESVYESLKRAGKSVFVLHLVRDFRSIKSSHLKLLKANQPILESVARDIGNAYCLPQKKNLAYIKHAPQGSNVISDERYLRIRYEDLANDATGTTEKVFRFMGMPNTPAKVSERIRNYLNPDSKVLKKEWQAKDLFGVVRDPKSVLRKWRDTMPFQEVLAIQEECGDVLEEMGYRMFASENELRNHSLPYF